jgi:hypothetical protein
MILAVAAIIFVAAYAYKFAPPSGWQLSSDTEQWGRFGAYIGGAFGMLAFIGVLITVDTQRRQLELQRHQVTLDELMRFSRDLASAIDEILKQPVETVAITQAQLIARNKSQVVAGVLELVDLDVLPAPVQAMPKLAETMKAYRNSLGSNAETLAQKLDLLATGLAEFTRLGGSRVIVALYRNRYRTMGERLGRLGASMKMQNWWLASSEQSVAGQGGRKEPTL